MVRPNFKSVALPVPEIIAIEVLGAWGCELPILVRGGRMGSGMVPFERALLSSYRSCIITFPLSLFFSAILSLLSSSTPLFPHPTSTLFKISPCSPGRRWMPFGLRRVKVLS